MKIQKIVLGLLFVALTGCEGSGGGSDGGTGGTGGNATGGGGTNSTSLTGTYESPCKQNADGNFEIETLTFDTTGLNSKVATYADNNCQTKALELVTKFSISAGTEANGIFPVDMTLNDILYTPLTADVAKNMNDKSACGSTNWSNGTSKSVLGSTCFQQKAGVKYYGIYSLDGTTLYLAEPVDTQANRPTQVDMTTAYTKK